LGIITNEKMTPRGNLSVGLDIGTTKVAICVLDVSESGEINVVGLTVVPHFGLRKGIVVDIEEVVSTISNALENVERMVGHQLDRAVVSIGGAHIESTPAKGVVAISKPNGEIDAIDVARVIDAAKAVALPQNRELIHIFPHHFLVDGLGEIRDPIGMTGVRLEVEALIVSGASAALRNLSRATEQSGINISQLVFSPLASARTVMSKKQRETGVAVADLGAGSTGVVVYEESEIIHCANLPIGSMHITNDIAIGLRTNLDLAEIIKLRHGTCLPANVRDGETINLASLDATETDRVPRKQVAEIIEARMIEICQIIKEELQKIGRDGLLPGGIIFTGGGSELEGLTELAKKHLRLPATIGRPETQISGIVDKLDDPVYATSIGLALWGIEHGSPTNANWQTGIKKLGGVFNRFGEIFRSFTN